MADGLRGLTEAIGAIFEQQPYCRIQQLVNKGLCERQAASRHLRQLEGADVLLEMSVGREKVLLHRRLLKRDDNSLVAH